MRPYGYLGAFRRVERAELRLAEVERLAAVFQSEWRDVGLPLGALWIDGELFDLRDVDVPDDLSIAAGEAMYNLRAALDYLIFALSWHDSGQRPTGDDARRLQFPIFEEEKAPFAERTRRSLRGVAEEHVAMLEEYQPYRGCTWTARLADFSNADKHRHLLELVGRVGVETESRHRGTPVEDAVPDEQGRYYAGDMILIDEARMDAAFADGELVVPTLQSLCREVRGFVERFGPEFRLHPIEPKPDYPIL